MKKLTVTLAVMAVAAIAVVAFAASPTDEAAPATCEMHGHAGHDAVAGGGCCSHGTEAATADSHCVKPQAEAPACHKTAATGETKAGAVCEHTQGTAAASCHGADAPTAEQAAPHAMGCCKS